MFDNWWDDSILHDNIDLLLLIVTVVEHIHKARLQSLQYRWNYFNFVVGENQQVVDFKQTLLEWLIVECVLLYLLSREFNLFYSYSHGYKFMVFCVFNFCTNLSLIICSGEVFGVIQNRLENFILYGSITNFLTWELVKVCAFGKLKWISYSSEVYESFLLCYKEIKTLSRNLKKGVCCKMFDYRGKSQGDRGGLHAWFCN